MAHTNTKPRYGRTVITLFTASLVTGLIWLARIDQQQAPEPIPDFAAIADVNARKDAFFRYLGPAIEAVNQERADERRRLLAIQQRMAEGGSLTYWDRRRLRLWAERYEIEYQPDNLASVIDPLLVQLDQIPMSMALAQAAMESAWGTSRFAVEGNNYFGQWCYSPGCGLIPSSRAAGARHEVRVFNSAEESIRAYFRNINSHAAYRDLREIRAAIRNADLPLSGTVLVEGLGNYSERGQDYIDELRAVIEQNDLE